MTENFDYSPEEIVELMQSREFQAEKANKVGAVGFDMSTEQADGVTTVVTRRKVPTAGLPEFVRSMVKATMEVIETERWRTHSSDGIGGDFEVDVKGAPVRLRGNVDVRPRPEGSSLTFSGDVEATVPFFKTQVAQAGSAAIVETIETEFRLLAEKVSERP